jgi:hypothetical protein
MFWKILARFLVRTCALGDQRRDGYLVWKKAGVTLFLHVSRHRWLVTFGQLIRKMREMKSVRRHRETYKMESVGRLISKLHKAYQLSAGPRVRGMSGYGIWYRMPFKLALESDDPAALRSS